MKALIAEDDDLTRRGLAEILRNEGFDVVQARDGRRALDVFQRDIPDFVCLDIMMPEINGYELCRRMRAIRAEVPIIFITAKSEEVDKVLGLEIGADDFIVKPFGVREVVARVRAILRRCQIAVGTVGTGSFRMNDLEVFPSELRARRGDDVIELSPRDVKILEMFVQRQGEVLDRNTIFNICWGEDYFPNSRSLDQHISQLRKRIEIDPKAPALIRTVHGAGYRYDG